MSKTAECILAAFGVGVIVGALVTGKTLNIHTTENTIPPSRTSIRPTCEDNFNTWWNYLTRQYGGPTVTSFSLDLDPGRKNVKCFIYENNRVVAFKFNDNVILIAGDRHGKQSVTEGSFTSSRVIEPFVDSTNPIVDVLNYYGKMNTI
jgi:hypothetical protein